MASKLPEDMPQKWKQTVLLQAAESAANVFRSQNPQQQQQQQQYGNAWVAEPAAQHLASPPAAGSKTATPAPDVGMGAGVPKLEQMGSIAPGQQQGSMQQQQQGQEGDVLPGLLAAAQNHPQLRSMPADKREALLKQLLVQHQARRAQEVMGQMPGMQQQGMMQGNALQASGRAGSAGNAGMDWGGPFNQQQMQQQQGPAGAATSLGLSPGLGNAGNAGAGDMLWMQGMSGPSSIPGRQQQQQQAGGQGGPGSRGAQTPHSSSMGFGGFPGLEQQPSGVGNDPFNAAFGAGSGNLDTLETGNTGSNWDGGNIFAGLMGGIGPEMRAQYMKKLQAQLELHGMNKKQLVENIKAKGALAALKSIGMLPSDLGAGAAAAPAADAAAGAGTGAAAGGGMDPAMAAAMPSDAAFAAMQRQQHLQQQLKLGPSQQAWLQHNQQAAAMSGMGVGMSDGMNALLAQQQQQWQGMMGMQQGMQGAYPSLMGPSLYGMDGMNGGGDRGMGSGPGSAAAAGGMPGAGAGMVDPFGSMMGGPNMLMQQQQQQHAMAFSSAMAGPYQQPHGTLGMLAAQQQLLYQQQQLAGMQMGQQPGMSSAAAAAAAMPWGGMGMGMQQGMQGGAVGVGSSAALDPPVLELPNLSPIKTGATAAMGRHASFGAAAGGSTSSAVTGAAAAAAAAAGPMGAGAAGAAASGRRGSQAGGALRAGSATQQQGLLQPLELPGSMTEFGGPEDEGIAMSPFGQLGLNAADVDALLSGFEPSSMNLLGQGDDGNVKMADLWSNLRSS